MVITDKILTELAENIDDEFRKIGKEATFEYVTQKASLLGKLKMIKELKTILKK